MATIARRLTPQPIKLRADIELTCYTPSGIEAIKKALRAGETASTEAVPIKAKLVAPPLYVLSTNATDKVRDNVLDIHHHLTRAIVRCDRTFRACHRIHSGHYRKPGRQPHRQDEGNRTTLKPTFRLSHLTSQPKAVSETDEHDLAQLMAKAGRENAEISGDEDDEEAIV